MYIFSFALQTILSRGYYSVRVCVCCTLRFSCWMVPTTYLPTCRPASHNEKKERKKKYIILYYIHLPFCKTRFSRRFSPPRRNPPARPSTRSLSRCDLLIHRQYTTTTRHNTHAAPMQVTESDIIIIYYMRTS